MRAHQCHDAINYISLEEQPAETEAAQVESTEFPEIKSIFGENSQLCTLFCFLEFCCTSEILHSNNFFTSVDVGGGK